MGEGVVCVLVGEVGVFCVELGEGFVEVVEGFVGWIDEMCGDVLDFCFGEGVWFVFEVGLFGFDVFGEDFWG